MNLILNINEALNAVKSNLLRTIFTVAIIAIGIFSLIGILTTIEGIKYSIQSSLSTIGSNVFEIQAKYTNRHSFGQRFEKNYPPITLKEAMGFKERYKFDAKTSLSTTASGIATVKYLANKTNPNIQVVGTDEHYMACESMELEFGRNFSKSEIDNGGPVVILGYQIFQQLFPNDKKKENVIGKKVNIFGRKYQIIGVLKNKGVFFGGAGGSRTALLPLKNVRKLPVSNELVFNIKTLVKDSKDIPAAIDQATAVMKRVRKDESRTEDSFIIQQSNAMLRSIEQISIVLKTGGIFISIITLIGASVGLINIMLVSVTERTREIGVRKALGATPLKIAIQFLIESVVICVLGGLLGILLGTLIGNMISFSMGSSSFYFPWGWTIVSFIACFIVGVFGGLYPAVKAARMDPIESLRFA